MAAVLELGTFGVAAETCCAMTNGDIPIACMVGTMPRVSVTPQRIESLLLSRHNAAVNPERVLRAIGLNGLLGMSLAANRALVDLIVEHPRHPDPKTRAS